MGRSCWAVLAMLVALPPAAGAQGGDPVRAQVERELARGQCSLAAWDVAWRGTLPGEARPVTVVTYTYENCGGRNNWGKSVGVYARDGASVRELPLPDRAGLPEAIQRVSVSKGRLLVEGLAYGPKDPHCCPSLKRRKAFVARDGRLQAVR
ncbi:hypothetical protein [Roseicella aquatilis]|uniref:Uncharacterized protein n=1 Tax=Roseicella aquatilis TaxID=2527868 RepID=A0A4R4DJG2_9PROT|nr:hypothetical protein [Roseicella aquatilis]TCZ59860.1 hypothetical protein EXY23_14765 [Roseicella aquatilis]